MHVGICTLHFRIISSHSLKEKRRIIKSIKDRVRSKFNVSIAEVDALDSWQWAVIGIACVSNDSGFANSVLSNVISFVEDLRMAELVDYNIEIQ
ncbi:TPA: DUF503 domain-containing protein [bacterium]|nr:DUF503 domain-containing protein [bacterium]